MNQTGVDCEIRKDGREVRFTLHGEIDHHGAKRVRSEMDAVIARHHPSLTVLDLSLVGFMDSAGLGLMLGRYARVSEYGGELVILNPTPSIVKILALAGADKLLCIRYEKDEGAMPCKTGKEGDPA